MALDFEKVADSEPTDKVGLEKLQALVDEADELDKQIDEVDALLKSMTTRYNYLKTKLLPDIMSELQSSSWRKSNGTMVEIADFVSGSLPKEEPARSKAIKWLEEHDGAALIKTAITVEFPKSRHNEALAMADDIRKAGFDAELKSDVHAQTLLSNVRERMRNGEEVDLEVLGVYAGRVAKITHAGKSSPTKVSKPKNGKIKK